jgi:hypothetical protein
MPRQARGPGRSDNRREPTARVDQMSLIATFMGRPPQSYTNVMEWNI